MKKISVSIVIMVCLITLFPMRTAWPADAIRDLPDAQYRCIKFINELVAGRIMNAFSGIQPLSSRPTTDEELEKIVAAFKVQNDQIRSHMGKMLEVKHIRTQDVEGIAAKMTFLQIHERDALVWSFIFYKSKGGWLFNNMNWTIKKEELFD